MFIVLTGRLRIAIRDPGGEEREIRESVAGDTVGELTLFDDGPRSATAYAVRATDVVLLKRDQFEELVERHPQMLMHITRTVVNRLVKPVEQGTDADVTCASGRSA